MKIIRPERLAVPYTVHSMGLKNAIPYILLSVFIAGCSKNGIDSQHRYQAGKDVQSTQKINSNVQTRTSEQSSSRYSNEEYKQKIDEYCGVLSQIPCLRNRNNQSIDAFKSWCLKDHYQDICSMWCGHKYIYAITLR